jgi:hypothetical protein
MGIELGTDEYLSPGRHQASPDEVEAEFVGAFPASQARRPLFDAWSTLSEAIERVVPLETQWVDGSFISSKIEPGDIDVVSHLDGPSMDELDNPAQMLLYSLVAGPLSKQLFGCDSYWLAVYPEGHPARPVYDQALEYWDQQFGSDREGAPKGYIEVVRT